MLAMVLNIFQVVPEVPGLAMSRAMWVSERPASHKDFFSYTTDLWKRQDFEARTEFSDMQPMKGCLFQSFHGSRNQEVLKLH